MVARNLRSLHRLFIPPQPGQYRTLYMLFAESNYVYSELLLLEIESDFTRTHFKDLTSWRLNAQILHISILWEKGLHYFARIHRKAKEGSERSAFNAFMLISSLWRGLERFACNA